jgi:hypothetical protein
MQQGRYLVSTGRESELFSSGFYRFLERELETLGQADRCALHAEPAFADGYELMTVELWDVAAVERFEQYWRDFRREHFARLGRLCESLRLYAGAAERPDSPLHPSTAAA